MSDTFEFDDRNHAERFVGTLHDPAATIGDVLTVQADKSIAAKPGGGAGGVQIVTVPVSSAEILDLANTNVTMIPGVAGKATLLGGFAIAYVSGVIPYLDNGGIIEVQGGNMQWGGPPGAGFWDQATSQVFMVGYGNVDAIAPAADQAGADIYLTCGSNPTLGDGTLLVTLSYFLAPTV